MWEIITTVNTFSAVNAQVLLTWKSHHIHFLYKSLEFHFLYSNRNPQTRTHKHTRRRRHTLHVDCSALEEDRVNTSNLRRWIQIEYNSSCITSRAIRSCRCGTATGNRTFRERPWIIGRWRDAVDPWQICGGDARWTWSGAAHINYFSFPLAVREGIVGFFSPLKNNYWYSCHERLGTTVDQLLNNEQDKRFHPSLLVCYCLLV